VIPNEYEAWWPLSQYRCFREIQISFPCHISNQNSSFVQPLAQSLYVLNILLQQNAMDNIPNNTHAYCNHTVLRKWSVGHVYKTWDLFCETANIYSIPDLSTVPKMLEQVWHQSIIKSIMLLCYYCRHEQVVKDSTFTHWDSQNTKLTKHFQTSIQEQTWGRHGGCQPAAPHQIKI